MKAFLLIVGVFVFSMNALASLPPKLEQLIENQRYKDLRTTVERINGEFCGAEGPGYVVRIKVAHNKKKYNASTGEITRTREWETVKIYGIFDTDLARPNPQLMDSENCDE